MEKVSELLGCGDRRPKKLRRCILRIYLRVQNTSQSLISLSRAISRIRTNVAGGERWVLSVIDCALQKSPRLSAMSQSKTARPELDHLLSLLSWPESSGYVGVRTGARHGCASTWLSHTKDTWPPSKGSGTTSLANQFDLGYFNPDRMVTSS